MNTYVTLKPTHYLKEGDELKEVRNATDKKSVYVCNGIYYEAEIIEDSDFFRLVDKKYKTDDFFELNTDDECWFVVTEPHHYVKYDVFRPYKFKLGSAMLADLVYRLFKFESNANKYCLNNKPCFTLNEVSNYVSAEDFIKLEEIAKRR